MRIAWLGPAPTDGHGVSFAATNLLRGVARAGVEVDCFAAAAEDAIPEYLRSEPGLRFFVRPVRWQWERWYSSTPLAAFATGQVARAAAQGALARLVAERHAAEPYDLVYQFSQIELGRLRSLRRRLPPIVLHPEVHAAGELRWWRRESALVRRCESAPRRLAVPAMLRLRTLAQRRDMALARLVIAPSRRFAELLEHDYGVPSERLQVVPNPIELRRFAAGEPEADRPRLVALYVSRMSVRKGVEVVVELSHRLSDLRDRLELKLVGDKTLWSDYRPLLRDLNGDLATYLGPQSTEIPKLYREADVLVQPAHYEPFSLAVAEALASGCPVIASDEVGAVEEVDRRCCRTFPPAMSPSSRHSSAGSSRNATAARTASFARWLDGRRSADSTSRWSAGSSRARSSGRWPKRPCELHYPAAAAPFDRRRAGGAYDIL
jgi:glycosyltransferase involved in cell wall biosynthesis